MTHRDRAVQSACCSLHTQLAICDQSHDNKHHCPLLTKCYTCGPSVCLLFFVVVVVVVLLLFCCCFVVVPFSLLLFYVVNLRDFDFFVLELNLVKQYPFTFPSTSPSTPPPLPHHVQVRKMQQIRDLERKIEKARRLLHEEAEAYQDSQNEYLQGLESTMNDKAQQRSVCQVLAVCLSGWFYLQIYLCI